jgi:hypothetical protein
MRRLVMLAALLAALLAAAPAARADAGWHEEQPVASGIDVPVPLGPVGDVEFWAPNRGLLTTAGNGGMPAGLYAYDGTGWYLLSTVCGGHDGRIAWAAPDEWWTIADQAPGPDLQRGTESLLWHRSLCHFVDGQVVGSYAEPLGSADSYLPMDAAACDGPDDCWFAGDRLPGTTNVGAFHLHWDGHAMTALPSLTTPQPELLDPPRAVADLAFDAGHLYESVQVQDDDNAPESNAQPYLLHEIVSDSSNPFLPLFPTPAVDYGAGVSPSQLAALHLSVDDARLWAVAGAVEGTVAHVTALTLDAGGLAPIPLQDPGAALPAGTPVNDIAAEPGANAAWLAFGSVDAGDQTSAHLTLLHADGTVDPPIALPTAADGISPKGPANRVACPAAGQCWMATTRGWLFHLGDDLPQDADPNFHRLITYRPPDNGVPFLPPDSLPIDVSGADQPSDQTPVPTAPSPPAKRRTLPVAYRIKQRMLHRTTLELSFSLRARASVELVARRRKRVVAHTRRETLRAGRHTLRLRLNPKRWPTSLDLEAHALSSKAKKG